MFFQYRFPMSGLCLRRRRLDTPLRLFTRKDIATLGGILNQQMYMVVFPVHLYKHRFKITAHPGEDPLKTLKSITVEYMSSILGNENKMNMHLENTMPSAPSFLVYDHRPKK
jgi:hypothetical protein